MGIEFVCVLSAAGAFLRAASSKNGRSGCVRYQRRVISDSTAKKGQGPPPSPRCALSIHTYCFLLVVKKEMCTQPSGSRVRAKGLRAEASFSWLF
jgi:hypothetical protein